ncbi:hypothetical protein BV455_03442 [Parageobacillus caldoxylosilyticus]|nr:hypothetical protein [Parageobacillus caldoxylosilyticus]QXJ40069.1 hypothetical protein BV455_03442 [Parageobacillus caldoxylosilyticus]
MRFNLNNEYAWSHETEVLFRFLGYILVFSRQVIYDGGLLADTVDHFLFSFK